MQHLSIMLERALDLKSMDLLTNQDPYCRLQVGNREQKSITIKGGGRNPVWNQTFTFEIGPNDNVLRVEIWDHDRWTRDDLIGTVEVPFTQLRQAGKHHVKAPVYTRSHKQHGYLMLDMEIKAPKSHQTPNLARSSMASSAGGSFSSNAHHPHHSQQQPPPHPIPSHAAAMQPGQAQSPYHPYQQHYAGAATHQQQHTQPAWRDGMPAAGTYKPFEYNESTRNAVEQLQAQLARLSAQREKMNKTQLHTYCVLQQYVHSPDVMRRGWYNDLAKGYENGNWQLQALDKEMQAVRTQLQRLSHPSQPPVYPPAVHSASYGSSHSSAHSSQGPSTWDSLPLASNQLSINGSHDLGTHHDFYSDTGRQSSHPPTYPGHANPSYATQQDPYLSDQNPHHYRPVPELGASSFVGLGRTDGAMYGSGEDVSLVSNRPAGGGRPAGAATTDDQMTPERMAARWRAIQRWKRFIRFVCINHFANKIASQGLLQDAHTKPAPPPPPPPPPPRGKPGGPRPKLPGGKKLGSPSKAATPLGSKSDGTVGGRASPVMTAAKSSSGDDGLVQDDTGADGTPEIYRDKDVRERWRAIQNKTFGGGSGSGNAGNLNLGGAGRGGDVVDAHMTLVDEINARGGHRKKVEADVERYGDMIRALATKVETNRSQNMDELCELVDAVNKELVVLVDIPAVLKYFPEWPEKRFDAMEEAVGMYRVKLGSKLRAMLNWEVPATPQKAILQSRMLIDDTRHFLDRIAPTKPGMEKTFKAHNLPWDPKIWDQVNYAALDLCAKQLRLTLKAAQPPRNMDDKQCVDLLQETLDMHFKVYQMVGGHNKEVQDLSQEVFRVWQAVTRAKELTG